MMKRRRILQAALAVPAVPALVAQQRPQSAGAGMEYPTIEVTAPDQVADINLRFFTPEQFAALRHLSGIIAPPLDGKPGAIEVGAPAFLDFLLSESLPDRQQLYRGGLDALIAQAKQRHQLPFAKLDTAQAEALLVPLRQPWTFDPPADPFARFLQAAKQDIRTATLNSRELAATASTGRRGGGAGQYWLPLD